MQDTAQVAYHTTTQAASQRAERAERGAPSWYRTPAEVAAYRARKAELYAAYLAAEGYEAIETAWNAFCEHVARGAR